MEPVGSLPHLQVPATCPYPERDKSRLTFKVLHLLIPLVIAKIAEDAGTSIFSVLIQK
jgi:hypothetical protein